MRILFALFQLLLLPLLVTSSNYYWVGNSGNWRDLTHWASSSGGAGSAYVSLPTTSDNVFFTAASFSSGGRTVTIDTNATCANLDFTGVANTPTLGGTSSYFLTCAGSLTFVAGMTRTFAGDVYFTGTGSHTITSAGKTFGRNVIVNSAGGTYTLQDAISVTSMLGLETGTLNTNNLNVSCGTLSANITDNVRTLNLTGSLVTITGSGTACDFRGNTTNLTLSSVSTCTLTFSNTAANITVEVGNKAKTIPNLSFPNCLYKYINSGSVATTSERITFRDIYAGGNAGYYIQIDNNSANTNQKTFGNINCGGIYISAANGTAFGAADVMKFTGTVTTNYWLWIYGGDYMEFQGAVIMNNGGNPGFLFYENVRMLSTLTITGAPAQVWCVKDFQIAGNVNINTTSALVYWYFWRGATFSGTFTTAASTNIYMFTSYQTASPVTFSTINTGVNSILVLGLGYQAGYPTCTLTVTNLNCGAYSHTVVAPATTPGTSTVTNLTLSLQSLVSFGSLGTSNHAIGALTYNGVCGGWGFLQSYNSSASAKVSFATPQSISYAVCKDLNITSANLTNTGGVDKGGNTGITFVAPTVGVTKYWIGGLSGNPKNSVNSTGNNNNWSNPDNWSTTSGVYTGTNSCIPGPQDNVVFDANSFTSVSNKTCEIDLPFVYANDLDWTGVTAGCYLDQTATNRSRTLYVFGNLTFAGANMTNNFEGVISMRASSAKTITTNGTQTYGTLYLDDPLGSWSLADNLTMNAPYDGGWGSYYSSLTINAGTLIANAVTINTDVNFIVNSGGTFNAGTSTVLFDATAAQNVVYQYITISNSATNAFYNLTVNRQNDPTFPNQNMVYCNSPTKINNNFIISGGQFVDGSYQVTGNATGILSVASGARLVVSWLYTATQFPTNYTYANISLHENSIVAYYTLYNQTVSGLPDYGELHLYSYPYPGYLSTKTLSEPVLIRTRLYMGEYNNFVDAGNQISFDGIGTNSIVIDPNSLLTLGNATTTTTFPANYTASAVDLDHVGNGCTVVYNGATAQTIEGLNGAGNLSYSHVSLVQPGGGGVTKTLNANTIIRGNLTIGANNVMDVSGSNRSITIGGNWTDNGTYTEQSGLVTFNGSTTQTINANNTTETFYDLTFNNTDATGISIADDIVVTHAATFTDGIVTAAGSEIVHINDNVTATGASSASYVDGKVRKIGDDAFVYPVGDDGFYAPINITAPSLATDHFTAQYINTNPDPTYDRTLKDPTLDHISKCEYWTLDRTNGASNVSVTLSWRSPGSCGVSSLPDLRVARWDGSMWKDHGNGGTTGNTSAGTVFTTTTVNAFSPFTLASTDASNPLSVSLFSFTAFPNADDVDVLWTTMSEINNDYFVVERSSDAENFYSLGTVDGAGNSIVVLNYKYIDDQPLPGTSYYRLKAVDFDGEYGYSKTVAVTFNSSFEWNLFPNPTIDGEIHLLLKAIENNVIITLKDILGKEIYSQSLTSGDKELLLPVLNISPGIYMVSIISPTVRENKKLIIQ